MSDTLPILYVIDFTTSEPGPRIDAVAAAATAAAALDWLPVWPAALRAEGHRAIEALMAVADAVLVIGHTKDYGANKAEQEQLYRLANHYNVPVYGVPPITSGYPQRRPLVAPPFFTYGQAAKKVRVSTQAEDGTWREAEEHWACKSCHRYWGGGPHAEHMARWCCVKEIPCSAEGCTNMTPKTWTHCSACREKGEIERYAKRERKSAGEGMVWSERDDEWFQDLEHAEWKAMDNLELEDGANKAAEVRAELEAMRLLTCEPRCAPLFDLEDHVRDALPTEEGDGSSFDALAVHVEDEVEALNAKLASAKPLCYEASDYAVLLDPRRS